MPSRRLDMAGWLRPPRLPLGDHWGGTCHAHADDIVEPLETLQREVCNCGYARGRCERFPESSVADAVRFSVTSDTGTLVQLVYVLEKDHAPTGHGVLEYSVAQPPSTTGSLLEQQARAFLETYLSRRVFGASA